MLKNSQSWLRARLQVHSYQNKDSIKQCELWGQGRGKQVSCCIFFNWHYRHQSCWCNLEVNKLTYSCHPSPFFHNPDLQT